MLLLPYLLSFSFGVISACLIALLITLLIHAGKLMKKRRVLNSVVHVALISFVIGVSLYLFFKDNTIFSRIVNILSGNDSSGNGRTIDAFILAEKLLKRGNEYWGIGPGQIKIMGEGIIRNYYFYYFNTPVAIPNAAAETLAIFGWVGFSLRLLIEVALFFYTRVWTNYYRLLLFLFVFIYQFTGSFITNGVEYMIWILAFTRGFYQFEVRRRHDIGPNSSYRLLV